MRTMNKTPKITKKMGLSIAAGLLAAITALNIFTVVDDGSVATTTFLGKVSPNIMQPGLNIINPLASVDTYSTRDLKMEFTNVQVPSQDKLKTSVDITLMLRFDGDKAQAVRINGGTERQAIDKYVAKKFESTVRESGKNIKKAQDLFGDATTQSMLQELIKTEVNDYSKPFGYEVTEVFLQEITLPKLIQDQVEQTKIREEAVNQAQADLDKAEKVAQQQVKTAEAARAAREENAIANERDADAKLYAAGKEAEANSLLQKTITPEMIKWRQLEVEMIRANKYQGGVPQTVVGAGYDGQMLMDMRSK
ncbi:hypothetical protein OFDDKENP_00073 [Aeromonas phage B614]|nr:hypothetical protein OFDDKENP_00073 [Aeromonas phage B614]UYD58201.1 hypothetical protein JNEOFJEA_00104 [Aeromonas phage UP87]UYD59977.1 hypothetical protein LEHPIFIF_00221 [Aeromonas phage avDM9-HANS]